MSRYWGQDLRVPPHHLGVSGSWEDCADSLAFWMPSDASGRPKIATFSFQPKTGSRFFFHPGVLRRPLEDQEGSMWLLHLSECSQTWVCVKKMAPYLEVWHPFGSFPCLGTMVVTTVPALFDITLDSHQSHHKPSTVLPLLNFLCSNSVVLKVGVVAPLRGHGHMSGVCKKVVSVL